MTEFVKDCFKSNNENAEITAFNATKIVFDTAEICNVLCDLYAITKNVVADTIERIEILIWIVDTADDVIEAVSSKAIAAVTA